MNRREFLFGALGAGAAGQAGGDGKQEQRPLAPHEVLVPTGKAIFILSLSHHSETVSAEVVEKADAVLLELGPFRDPAVLENPKVRKWLGDVLRTAREKRIPVFLIDSDDDATAVDEWQHWIVQWIELLVGLGAIAYGLGARDESESRRHVLGRWLSILVGTYLAGPLVVESATQMALPSKDGGLVIDHEATRSNRAVRKFNKQTRLSALEPSYTSIDFRNAVMAHKAHIVAQLLGQETGKAKPLIPMFVGGFHYGVEDYLNMSEADREKAIAEKQGLFRLVGPIIRLDFVQENGEEKVKVTVIEEKDFPGQPE